MDRILNEYWRTMHVKEQLKRYTASEEYRQKQAEIARLEQQLESQRFWFLRRRQPPDEIERKREELKALSAKEAARAQERENEAVEDLLIDIRETATEAGRNHELTVIFDRGMPEILYVDTSSDALMDVSDMIIESLNAR
ncbi:MAG: hypothetical protein Kow0099_20040 [Candidatus Abyssubacteria bacterium]